MGVVRVKTSGTSGGEVGHGLDAGVCDGKEGPARSISGAQGSPHRAEEEASGAA